MRFWWMGIVAACAGAGAGAVAGPAQARFDTRVPDSGIAGRPSEVLVLGTPHLSDLPKTFRASDLSLLLDRLAAWHPAAITTESPTGEQCDTLERYAALHPDAAEHYCWDRAPARAATGLDVVAASVAVEKTLAAWPATPRAADRRRLAALFLAAGDRASALVQWLRLPEGERHAGDSLEAALVAVLEKVRVRDSEDYLIAAPLAARLGLERVYPCDDHTADNLSFLEPGFEAAMTRIWSGPGGAKRKALGEQAQRSLGTPAGTLALYRFHNSPDQPRLIFDSDFGAALKDAAPERFGRQYVAWWETRNLRMAANIRAVAGLRPGSRVLSIVGASHKPYFEAYLAMMHDVRVADTGAVLYR